MPVSYTKTTWINDSAPYLNETNLNNIETGIEDCANEINAHEADSDIHFSALERTKLSGIASGAQVNPTAAELLASIKTVDGATSGLDADTLDGNQASAFVLVSEISNYLNKVTDTLDDIPDGTSYVKSQNNFTNVLLSKLNGIESGAEVNVNPDWDAVSGDAQILNKPSTFTPAAHMHTESEITDLGSYEPSFLKNTAFNKNFGTGTGTVCEGNDSRLSDARTPTAHNHSASEVTDFDTEVGNHADVAANTTHRGRSDNPHSVSKSQVGLGNVVNELQVIAKAGGKNLWVQATEPTAIEIGDIWIQTS